MSAPKIWWSEYHEALILVRDGSVGYWQIHSPSPPWFRELPTDAVELVPATSLAAQPAHEVECPSCGTTIRARMADAPPAEHECIVPDHVKAVRARQTWYCSCGNSYVWAWSQPPPAEPAPVRTVDFLPLCDWLIQLSFAIEKWEKLGYADVVRTIKILRDRLDRIVDGRPAESAPVQPDAELERLRKAVADSRAYIQTQPYSEYPLRTSTLYELLTGRAAVPTDGTP